MKLFKSFSTKSAIATGTSVLAAGAGSAVADWALAKWDIIPADYAQYTNIGKVLVGAVVGSMVKNQIAKSAFDGIATVGAANLVAGWLPAAETTTTTSTDPAAGLPEGMIGRLRMGQRGFRRGVRGVSATPAALMSK